MQPLGFKGENKAKNALRVSTRENRESVSQRHANALN